MSWLERLRDWDFDLGDIWGWFAGIVEFHYLQQGWMAYVYISVIAVVLGIAFPPTRGVTSLLVSGLFRTILTTVQIVVSLLTVSLVQKLAMVLASSAHGLRRRIAGFVSRSKDD